MTDTNTENTSMRVKIMSRACRVVSVVPEEPRRDSITHWESRELNT